MNYQSKYKDDDQRKRFDDGYEIFKSGTGVELDEEVYKGVMESMIKAEELSGERVGPKVAAYFIAKGALILMENLRYIKMLEKILSILDTVVDTSEK